MGKEIQMRLALVTFLLAMVCISGVVSAAPDEAPAPEKTVAENVSVQLMDYGEGANRMLKLTLSHAWSDLPDSTKKHVLTKLRTVLPEASLKQALLALAKGEKVVEVSAAPAKQAAPAVPMVKVVPARPVQKSPGAAGKTVQPGKPATLGGLGAGDVGVEVEIEGLEDMPEEMRARILEVLKKHGDARAPRMRLGQPGHAVRIFELEKADADKDDADEGENPGQDVRTRVKAMIAGDGSWQQLSPEMRKLVLESLRQSVPPQQMAAILKALAQAGPRARRHSFQVRPGMPGQPDMSGQRGCQCQKPGPQQRGCQNRKSTSPQPGCVSCGRKAKPPHHGQFARPDCAGPRGRGMRRGGGGQQDALVRALVALTHEVQALRREVAAMRSAHHGQSPVSPPQRRVMLRSMGGDWTVTPPAPARNLKPEEDMAKLRAEMAEIRAALKHLMKDLKKLQAEK